MPSKLEELRQIIIEATPGKDWDDSGYDMAGNYCTGQKSVTLADVLNAVMHTEHVLCIASNERFELLDKEKNEWVQQFKTWCFSDDDLEGQSPETIDFLHQLLSDNSDKEKQTFFGMPLVTDPNMKPGEWRLEKGVMTSNPPRSSKK